TGLGSMGLSGGGNYLQITAGRPPNLSGSHAYNHGTWVHTGTEGAEYFYKGDGGWNFKDQAFYLTGSNAGGATSGFIPGGVQWAGGFVGGNTPIASGAWSFISLVRSGGTSTIYVNGAATGTSTGMSLPEQGAQDM